MGKLPSTKAFACITDVKHGKGYKAKAVVMEFGDGLQVMLGAPTVRELKRVWGKLSTVGMNDQGVQSVVVFQDREALRPQLVKGTHGHKRAAAD